MATPGIRIPSWLGYTLGVLALVGMGIWVAVHLHRDLHPPEPDCVTECGLKIYGSRDCQSFWKGEPLCLNALAKHVNGWSRPALCAILDHWSMGVVPERMIKDGAFEIVRTDGTHEWVAGFTSGFPMLKMGKMLITPVPLYESSFCHEYAHAFEISIDQHYPDYDHSTWVDRGIYEADAEWRFNLRDGR